METIGFFTADIFITVVVALSFIIGWIRGATKEILTIVAWAGGIYLTISLFPFAKEFTRSYISHGLIADFVTACALFILFLTILSIFSYLCSDLVKKSLLKTTDKALGGVIGIIRGVVVLAIFDLLLTHCMLAEPPKWIEDSVLRPKIDSVSNFIVLLLPEDLQDTLLSHMSQIKRQSLMDFIKNGVIGDISPNSTGNIVEECITNRITAADANKLSGEDDFVENNEEEFVEDMTVEPMKKEQTAEDLATLKPKKKQTDIGEIKGGTLTKKEKNDMSRILDQFDDIDED